jgi:hypothetical protein
MTSKIRFTLFALAAFVLVAEFTAFAQSQSIQARISGGGGNGKCTFEVVVRGSAEVQIRGSEGNLRTLSGSPAQWRRLDCNQPLPFNPSNFKFNGVDGHGHQNLSADPNSNSGVAVIRIDNTTGGNEGYTGDITWNVGNNSGNGDWGYGNNNDNGSYGYGKGNWNGTWNGQAQNIRARISGGGGSGKCTFEVVVSGPATEVRIRGDQGNLRVPSDSQAQWRRLDCNQPLPLQPVNFRFSGVDGHGRQTLVQDPDSNNGIAVIRIDNGNRRNEGYTGDITWNGGGNNSWGNYHNNYSANGGAYWDGGGTNSAVQACQDTIVTQLRSDHRQVQDVQFRPDSMRVSRRSGDLGDLEGDGQYRSRNGSPRGFTFRCSYDFRNGQVRESAYQQQ